MNKILPCLLLFSLFAVQCKKNKLPKECLTGKVIILTCSMVIQVLNNNNVGEDNWKDIKTGQFYDNVFVVANSCKFPTLKSGDIVFFTIQQPNSDCGSCLAYDGQPGKKYDIKKLYTEPCEKAQGPH